MKHITFVVFALISSFASAADMTLPIRGGIDGDTIRTSLPLPCPLCNVSIRIRGVDTPEKGARAQCPAEAALAKEASACTATLIGTNKTMTVTDVKWDKYGGRIDAVVTINGVVVGDELIKRKLAVPYNGGKKQSWCN